MIIFFFNREARESQSNGRINVCIDSQQAVMQGIAGRPETSPVCPLKEIVSKAIVLTIAQRKRFKFLVLKIVVMVFNRTTVF